MSSLTLPKSGSMRNGQLLQQPTLALPIYENDYSSLPTPHAGLGERGRDGVILNPKGQQDLQHAIAHLLPTPRVGGVASDRGIGSRDDTNLHAIAQRLAANGNSTNSPSEDGNTYLDDQHPTPQLWQEQENYA
jgi:hypothetical protein